MIPLQPKLDSDTYVFCQLPLGTKLPFRPLCVFEEAEGLTMVLADYQARSLGYEPHFHCKRITLDIESKLEAIGLLATVTTILSAAKIPCNVVSAFSHDHLFVPLEMAQVAYELIRNMTWTPA